MRSEFQCTVEKDGLVASPNIGHSFQNFSIITEQLAHETKIDCDDPFASVPDQVAAALLRIFELTIRGHCCTKIDSLAYN